MVAHCRRVRKALRERPEPRERARGVRLVEEADRGRRLRLGVPRRSARGRGELAARRHRPAEPLQRGAVEQLGADAAAARVRRERVRAGAAARAGEARRAAGSSARRPGWPGKYSGCRKSSAWIAESESGSTRCAPSGTRPAPPPARPFQSSASPRWSCAKALRRVRRRASASSRDGARSGHSAKASPICASSER